MSIAVLNQVYDEARRLCVAGSAVAPGDFRLKKLLPPLEAAGAKAPVFARVAEAAKAVVDGPESQSAQNLLELTSLVTAVLSTQGETGRAGPLEPIETTDLGASTQPTSARLLKPLLEALNESSTGKFGLIREAHERGLFRDLRLVLPALNALDRYHEVSDFIAEDVLPTYGAAIVPLVRAQYAPKGKVADGRRLKLLYRLDPIGSRELVLAAVEGGSKEVRIAALGCLGSMREDLEFLLEQAAAKSADVREAAYTSLARVRAPEATAALARALAGKDLVAVAGIVSRCENPDVLDVLVAELKKTVAAMLAAKEKKEVGVQAGRAAHLVQAVSRTPHPGADAALIDLFTRRAELERCKGDATGKSGSDVAEAVVRRMVYGSTAVQQALARAHAELPAEFVGDAAVAGVASLPPAEVYELFSPYLLGAGKGKAKEAANRRERVVAALGGASANYYHRPAAPDRLDSRWFDAAVFNRHLGLMVAAGRPGHPGAEQVLREEFAAVAAKGKGAGEFGEVLTAMVRLQHPEAADFVARAAERFTGKSSYYDSHWVTYLVPELPKSALPALEAVLPKLKAAEADRWADALESLRAKADG